MRRCALTCVLALCWSVQPSNAQVPVTRQPPVPVEPVSAILDVFKTHAIVAISEPHGNQQAHDLRLKLMRDPRFPAIVSDIVVETGTARYQDVIDRFIRGDEVPDSALRHVWQDIVTPGPTGDLQSTKVFSGPSVPPMRTCRDSASFGCSSGTRRSTGATCTAVTISSSGD